MNDLDEINRQLKQETGRSNATPLDDFDRLSPEDMHGILYLAFTRNCPVQLRRNPGPEVLDHIRKTPALDHLMLPTDRVGS